MSMIEDQKEFMKAAGQIIDKYDFYQIGLYIDLIEEESLEFFGTNCLKDEIKEAVDILVVTIGFLISTGIDVHKAWNLVHENNMLKVKTKPEYDENGKVKKSKASIAAKEKMMKEIEKLINEVK